MRKDAPSRPPGSLPTPRARPPWRRGRAPSSSSTCARRTTGARATRRRSTPRGRSSRRRPRGGRRRCSAGRGGGWTRRGRQGRSSGRECVSLRGSQRQSTAGSIWRKREGRTVLDGRVAEHEAERICGSERRSGTRTHERDERGAPLTLEGSSHVILKRKLAVCAGARIWFGRSSSEGARARERREGERRTHHGLVAIRPARLDRDLLGRLHARRPDLERVHAVGRDRELGEEAASARKVRQYDSLDLSRARRQGTEKTHQCLRK